MTACPNCGAALAKAPQRKSKCPLCKEPIFVKATPGDPVKRLVTAARAEEIEAEWERKRDQDDRDEMASSLRLPKGMSAALLRRALERVAGRGEDPHPAKLACIYLARISGELPERRRWAIKANEYEVLQLVPSRRGDLMVRAGRGACPACLEKDGSVLSASKAIKQGTPSPSCPKWEQAGFSCAFWIVAPAGNPYGFKPTRIKP